MSRESLAKELEYLESVHGQETWPEPQGWLVGLWAESLALQVLCGHTHQLWMHHLSVCHLNAFGVYLEFQLMPHI